MAKTKDELGRNTVQMNETEIDKSVKQWCRKDSELTGSVYDQVFSDGDILSTIEKKLGHAIVSERVKEFHSVDVSADVHGIRLSSYWMFQHDIGTYQDDKVSGYRIFRYASLLPEIIDHIESAYDDVAPCYHDGYEKSMKSLKEFAQAILCALDKAPPKPSRDDQNPSELPKPMAIP